MNEDKLKALLQQDMNLRDAIRQEEAERPQMPADLNARLMQRVAQEKKQKRTRMVWPWIAVACVAGIMVVFLTPPKETIEENEIVAKVEKKVEKKQESEPEAPVKAEPKATPATPAKRQQQPRKPVAPTTAPKQLIAQEAAPVEPVDNKQVAVINEPTAKSQELTASLFTLYFTLLLSSPAPNPRGWWRLFTHTGRSSDLTPSPQVRLPNNISGIMGLKINVGLQLRDSRGVSPRSLHQFAGAKLQRIYKMTKSFRMFLLSAQS